MFASGFQGYSQSQPTNYFNDSSGMGNWGSNWGTPGVMQFNGPYTPTSGAYNSSLDYGNAQAYLNSSSGSGGGSSSSSTPTFGGYTSNPTFTYTTTNNYSSYLNPSAWSGLQNTLSALGYTAQQSSAPSASSSQGQSGATQSGATQSGPNSSGSSASTQPSSLYGFTNQASGFQPYTGTGTQGAINEYGIPMPYTASGNMGSSSNFQSFGQQW